MWWNINAHSGTPMWHAQTSTCTPTHVTQTNKKKKGQSWGKSLTVRKTWKDKLSWESQGWACVEIIQSYQLPFCTVERGTCSRGAGKRMTDPHINNISHKIFVSFRGKDQRRRGRGATHQCTRRRRRRRTAWPGHWCLARSRWPGGGWPK